MVRALRHDGDMFDEMVLDEVRCYRAAQSRDARFDGWFYIAVRTTGIYCRPSCPAVTPKRQNVEFHPTAAAAQQRGFRACKRCRPDAAPGSPEWDVRGDVVARAMRLIGDGVVDRDGVGGLAGRLGYSERHLNRLLTDELGAGPLALARAQRAQTARTLVETTGLSMTDIAFAAGFGSVRQFNDTIREVFASSPTDLRHRAASPSSGNGAGAVTVRLPARAPFAGREVFEFLGARAIPGVETWDGSELTRTLDLPRGHGVVTVALADGGVRASFRLTDWRDLAPAAGRVRRLLDLDADPVAIDEFLGADPDLTTLVARTPGLRVPGSVDPHETLVRAIVGQQVSVAGARTVAGRIAHEIAEPLEIDHPELTHLAPSMERIAKAGLDAFPMPRARAETLQRAARAIVDGLVVLDPGVDRGSIVADLVDVKGIGPWTANYVVMRGLRDPDVFLATDLGVKHALAGLGLEPDAADRWRPWRSYAMHHLWNKN